MNDDYQKPADDQPADINQPAGQSVEPPTEPVMTQPMATTDPTVTTPPIVPEPEETVMPEPAMPSAPTMGAAEPAIPETPQTIPETEEAVETNTGFAPTAEPTQQTTEEPQLPVTEEDSQDQE